MKSADVELTTEPDTFTGVADGASESSNNYSESHQLITCIDL